MKVLFVCHQNVGRSQMAKAFYNHLTHTNDADAAGTVVNEPGQTLLERKAASTSKNFFLLDVMKETGIDISHFTRSPLVQEELSRYDAVISMETKAASPDWLLASPNYVYWDVPDPRGQDLEHTRLARDNVKARVEDLIRQTEKAD